METNIEKLFKNKLNIVKKYIDLVAFEDFDLPYKTIILPSKIYADIIKNVEQFCIIRCLDPKILKLSDLNILESLLVKEGCCKVSYDIAIKMTLDFGGDVLSIFQSPCIKLYNKLLYTLYTVEGELDDIRNNPSHNFVSYSSGRAECIKYYDSVATWIKAIAVSGYKIGFGVKSVTKDGNKVQINRHDLEYNTYTCNNLPHDNIIKGISDITSYYHGDSYYYEIEEDGLYIREERTGHIYYRSPHESCDECCNCDGAKCDSCKTKYTVVDLNSDKEYYSGFDKEKAERIYTESLKDYSSIIADILLRYNIDMSWFYSEINSLDYKSLLKILNKYKIPYITVTK